MPAPIKVEESKVTMPVQVVVKAPEPVVVKPKEKPVYDLVALTEENKKLTVEYELVD